MTGVPRARITGYKVVLDTTNHTPLWDITDSLGYSSVNGMLGMSRPVTDGAAAWVHSRREANGTLRVSTQFLYVDSTVLARYQSDEAFANSADSYGGINSNDTFLRPDDKSNENLRDR